MAIPLRVPTTLLMVNRHTAPLPSPHPIYSSQYYYFFFYILLIPASLMSIYQFDLALIASAAKGKVNGMFDSTVVVALLYALLYLSPTSSVI